MPRIPLKNPSSGPALVVLLFSLLFSGCASSPGTYTERPAERDTNSPTSYVSESFLRTHLNVLAHDTLYGRGTGETGSQKAADYLFDFYTDENFSVLEDISTRRQTFSLKGVFWDSVSYSVYQINGKDTVQVSDTGIKSGTRASFYPILGGKELLDAPVFFAGYGPVERDWRKVDNERRRMRDSWVMVFERPGNPSQDPDTAEHRQTPSRKEQIQQVMGHYNAGGVILVTAEEPDPWEEQAVYMSRLLENPATIWKEGKGLGRVYPSSAEAVAIHPDLAARMLNLSDRDQLDSLRRIWQTPASDVEPVDTGFRFRSRPVLNKRSFEESNIVTVIPGSDEQLKKEVVVLTAHYDHMGFEEPDYHTDIIYNGADDNASGTVVLMQVAETIRRASENGYRPSRTIVFLHAAAEEWGLYGSRHYVENPSHPLDDIIANVNADMVGHVDDDYAEKEDTDYIYVIGAGLVSSRLEELLQEANASSYDLHLDPKYNDVTHPRRLYRRSDHWPFGERNIPFVFFFSGLHGHYHKPTDTVDRIAWPLLASRAELITELVWRLVETPEPPEVDRPLPGTPSGLSR